MENKLVCDMTQAETVAYYMGQLMLKDKIIELMAKRMEIAFMGDYKEFIKLFERKALAELER